MSAKSTLFLTLFEKRYEVSTSCMGSQIVPLDILFKVPTYIGLAEKDLSLKSSLTLYLLLLFLMLLPCLHVLLA